MRQLFFILTLASLFTGCIQSNADSYKLKYWRSTSTTNFSSLTKSLLHKLCPTIKKLPTTDPITVIDFTNIQDLENHSELGFLLSEEIKTHTTQKCNRTVNQIEFMRYLKVGANGTKLFSRDFNDIKNEKIGDTGYALVGTYAFTQRQLILYLKLLDLSNGVIIKSSTVKTELTDEIIHLEQKPKQEKTNIYRPMVL